MTFSLAESLVTIHWSVNSSCNNLFESSRVIEKPFFRMSDPRK